MRVDIGLNTCCFTRRWERPENWIRLPRELGFSKIQLDSDMLDPFFSGDRAYQERVSGELKALSARYGVEITNYYTGMASYRFHGISHSDGAARRRMAEWIEGAMDLAVLMGADRVGGRFDAYSVEVLQDAGAFERRLAESVEMYRALAISGKKKGLKALELEQMYVPSLYPYTLGQAQEYLVRLNEGNEGCRLGLTVDTGHVASRKYGGSGDDLSYEEWLRRFAAASRDIHIQQSREGSSSHDPFTAECNESGYVQIDRLLEAVRYGHEHAAEQPWSGCLAPVEDNVLVLEYIPSTADTEDEILEKLEESVSYLRKFIPEGGLEL